MAERRTISVENVMEKNGSSFDEWIENHRWFRSNYQKLARKYDGQNVCIYKRRVLDFDTDLGRLLKRVRKNYPMDCAVVEWVSRKKPKLILGNWTADVSEGFYAPPHPEGSTPFGVQFAPQNWDPKGLAGRV